jgi:hypothetical protein
MGTNQSGIAQDLNPHSRDTFLFRDAGLVVELRDKLRTIQVLQEGHALF